MIRFLADVNLRGAIVRGIKLRDSTIEIIRAQDVGLDGTDDDSMLAWAAEHDCILLTHDRATVPKFAWQRVAIGQPSAASC